MPDGKYIENVEAMEFARDHTFTSLLLSHVCHVTTPDNFISILEDGYIKTSTTRNGMLARHKDAHPSVCMQHNAVSVFDFGVSPEAMFPIHQRLEGVYRYDMHWWNYFILRSASVTILLDGTVREEFVQQPEVNGQFIRGTEFCHRGDIPASKFIGFILVLGSLNEQSSVAITKYGLAQMSELKMTVSEWLDRRDRRHGMARRFGLDPDVMSEHELNELSRLLDRTDEDFAP